MFYGVVTEVRAPVTGTRQVPDKRVRRAGAGAGGCESRDTAGSAGARQRRRCPSRAAGPGASLLLPKKEGDVSDM